MKPLAASLALTLAAVLAPPAQADTTTIYATQSGFPAYDRDPFGGNPFASAVIAALADPDADPADTLIEQTVANSGGQQFPVIDELAPGTRLAPRDGEVARALVVVFADYGDDAILPSLPGATFDAHRVAEALAEAGYEVEVTVAHDAAGYLGALDAFAHAADEADRALVYTTGHGVEIDGTIYLIPPEAERASDILAATLTLPDIRARLDGPGERLLLYAGCRDNPLELTPPAAPSRGS